MRGEDLKSKGVSLSDHRRLRCHGGEGGGLRQVVFGMDVIITDHHEVGDDIPNACCILNPKVSDCPFFRYNFAVQGLASSHRGVMCRAQGAGIAESSPTQEELDLVAMATIADAVSPFGCQPGARERGLKHQHPGSGSLHWLEFPESPGASFPRHLIHPRPQDQRRWETCPTHWARSTCRLLRKTPGTAQTRPMSSTS